MPPGTAAGVYDLDASCSFGFLEEQGGPTPAADAPAGNGAVFEYATQPFTVTAQPTSTTAGPTTTTTAGQTTTTVRPAVAAQAVRTAPAFTG